MSAWKDNPPMSSAVFRVELRQRANNLKASIEVVSLTSSAAKRFVLNRFFNNEGHWEVIKTTKVRDLPH